MSLMFENIHAIQAMDASDNAQENVRPRGEPAKKLENGYISTMFRCNTADATHLCILDSALKLSIENNCDIGGTYRKHRPEFWFYYTTTICPKTVYLLNLFVCHRQTGMFAIGVPNSTELSHKITSQYKKATIQSNTVWRYFKSTLKDENHFIKTYSFSLKDLRSLENSTLLIPITIKIDHNFSLNEDIERSIKLDLDIVTTVAKQEKPDFTVVSKSGKEYPAHKLILMTSSRILRKKVTGSKENKITFDLDDEAIEMLLEFISTGTLSGLGKRDSTKLLLLYDEFQIKPLVTVIQYLLGRVIAVDNAVDVAIIAVRHKLTDLMLAVFKFIKNNPDVLNTESWLELDDVEVAKALYQYSNK